MTKKILLAISLIVTVALLIIFQSARTYFATGVSALFAVLLFLLVLILGAVILFITFFLWQTGSFKASGTPKKALPIIGGVIAAIILTILLATGSFSSEGGFPLALWLIVFVPLWAYRVYLEFTGQYDGKKAGHVTLNMVSVYSIIATLVIFALQGSTSNWWGNVMGSNFGRYLVYSSPFLFVLKYFLPGTGSDAVKWGGWIATAVGIFLVIGIIATAMGGGSSSKKVYREVHASAPDSVSASVVPPSPPKYEDTIAYLPRWTPENQGWTEIEIPKAGTYEIAASGSVKQPFRNPDHGGIDYYDIGPEGMTRDIFGRLWISPVSYQFPLPQKPVGYLMARVDDRVIPVGRRTIIDLPEGSKLFFSTNNLQNNPDDFRVQGGFTVKIKES